MNKLWYSKLNFLLQKHEQKLKNEQKSAIYEEWISNGIFLPKKYRHHKDNMSKEEREAAHKLGFADMKKDVSSMREQALKAYKTVEGTNNFMIDLITILNKK